MEKIIIEGDMTLSYAVEGDMDLVLASDGEVGTYYISRTESYTGEYEYTPTEYTQTIPVANKRATQDITINPIPSNYGLITWNGSTLTVS